MVQDEEGGRSIGTNPERVREHGENCFSAHKKGYSAINVAVNAENTEDCLTSNEVSGRPRHGRETRSLTGGK